MDKDSEQLNYEIEWPSLAKMNTGVTVADTRQITDAIEPFRSLMRDWQVEEDNACQAAREATLLANHYHERVLEMRVRIQELEDAMKEEKANG